MKKNINNKNAIKNIVEMIIYQEISSFLKENKKEDYLNYHFTNIKSGGKASNAYMQIDDLPKDEQQKAKELMKLFNDKAKLGPNYDLPETRKRDWARELYNPFTDSKSPYNPLVKDLPEETILYWVTKFAYSPELWEDEKDYWEDRAKTGHPIAQSIFYGVVGSE